LARSWAAMAWAAPYLATRASPTDPRLGTDRPRCRSTDKRRRAIAQLSPFDQRQNICRWSTPVARRSDRGGVFDFSSIQPRRSWRPTCTAARTLAGAEIAHRGCLFGLAIGVLVVRIFAFCPTMSGRVRQSGTPTSTWESPRGPATSVWRSRKSCAWKKIRFATACSARRTRQAASPFQPGPHADPRALFRYITHTLPSEISAGTSTMFAARNAAVYSSPDRRRTTWGRDRRPSLPRRPVVFRRVLTLYRAKEG